MSSFYTVVQYVPDPIADERVNVGVVAFGQGVIRTRFLRRWRRVQLFGAEDIAFLRDMARRAEEWSSPEVPLPGMGEAIRVDEAGIRSIAGRWMNSVQFTEPRASLLSPEDLLSEMSKRFLRQPGPTKRAFRDRRAAASLAATSVREALQRAVGPKWQRMMKRNVTVEGKLDQHRFDLTVQNGRLLFAAHGLSFEGPVSRDLEKDIEATAWTFDDVRASDPELPLSVVALPPRTSSKAYDRAIHIFEGLKAQVIPEGEVDKWAEAMAATASD